VLALKVVVLDEELNSASNGDISKGGGVGPKYWFLIL
jgi:hypothetical protein